MFNLSSRRQARVGLCPRAVVHVCAKLIFGSYIFSLSALVLVSRCLGLKSSAAAEVRLSPQIS